MSEPGAMELAVRKWDGDVFRGHEPEAWADLRMRAREQDAALAAKDARIAELEAAAQTAATAIVAIVDRLLAEGEVDTTAIKQGLFALNAALAPKEAQR